MIAPKNFNQKSDPVAFAVLDSEVVNDLRKALLEGNPMFQKNPLDCEVYLALTVSLLIYLTVQENEITVDALKAHIDEFSQKVSAGNTMPHQVLCCYVDLLLCQGILLLHTVNPVAKFSLTPAYCNKMKVLRDNVEKVLEKVLTEEEEKDKNP